MLDNVWLIPLLPAVSFAIILLAGKRLPFKGAESGIVAVGASFVLSVVVAAKWIGEDAPREAIEHSSTWLQSGRVRFGLNASSA